MITRATASFAAAYALRFLEVGRTVGVPGYSPPQFTGLGQTLFGVWLRADALWYLRIATVGYGHELGAFAFFPMFPLIVRLFRPLFGGNELLAGLFVASVSCLVGYCLLYALVRRMHGPGAARAAVLGLAVFPTAFFLVAPYGEPVLLLAGSAALLAIVSGHSRWAAVAGGVAALSRPFGVLIALPMFLLSARSGKAKARWASGGPILAALGWAVYVGWKTGHFANILSVQALWQRQLANPLVTLARGASTWWQVRGTDLSVYFFFDLATAVFAVVLIAIAVKQRRWALASYGAAAVLVAFSSVFPPRPLLSFPRFVLAIFPLFAAYEVVPKKGRIPLALVSVALMFAATAAYVAARPVF
ncbi:MAG: glycosyltransferase family 39 protein [Actinomycetota bacterium]